MRSMADIQELFEIVETLVQAVPECCAEGDACTKKATRGPSKPYRDVFGPKGDNRPYCDEHASARAGNEDLPLAPIIRWLERPRSE